VLHSSVAQQCCTAVLHRVLHSSVAQQCCTVVGINSSTSSRDDTPIYTLTRLHALCRTTWSTLSTSNHMYPTNSTTCYSIKSAPKTRISHSIMLAWAARGSWPQPTYRCCVCVAFRFLMLESLQVNERGTT